MIRLLFVISSLNRGGAERQLTLLAKELDHARFAVTVVTLYDGGTLAADIQNHEGVTLISVHKKGRTDYLLPLWRMLRIAWRVKPQVIHGYLDVANILALGLGRLTGAKVVWGIRASNVDFALYDRRSSRLFRLACRLSRFPDLIVANSYSGKQHHIDQGYAAEHVLVIPNGFDTDLFQPDPDAGRRMRRQWGVGTDERVIGLVARLDPIKDHRTFLEAAAILAQSHDNVRFVCVGDGSSWYRQELQDWAAKLGLTDRVIWTGERAEICAVNNALDIATSSSLSEGFSNTIGEAMACGVPCVATDVGDSAVLVGDTGCIVPVRDAAAMAAAWQQLLDLFPEQRSELSRAARDRITCQYSLQQLVRRTESALERLLGSAPTT